MRRASGLVVIKDNKILMVGRKSGRIGIPGGKTEEGESSIEGAIRETYEETGIVCYVPYEVQSFHRKDVEGFQFTAWVARPVAGILTSSNEGPAFWLDLGIFKRAPTILHYPEWSRDAARFFKL